MTNSRERKVANSSGSKKIEHVDDVLKKKNKRDKGSRRYTEEKE